MADVLHVHCKKGNAIAKSNDAFSCSTLRSEQREREVKGKKKEMSLYSLHLKLDSQFGSRTL